MANNAGRMSENEQQIQVCEDMNVDRRGGDPSGMTCQQETSQQ